MKPRTKKPASPRKRSENGGRGFPKGRSGNPARRFGQPAGNPADLGGRPRSVAESVREKVGGDGEQLIESLLKISRRGSTSARVRAIQELLNRGFGRVKDEIEVVVAQSAEQQPLDLSPLSADELAVMIALYEKCLGQHTGPRASVITVGERGWVRVDGEAHLVEYLSVRLEWRNTSRPPAPQPEAARPECDDVAVSPVPRH